jgi:hypothetical protein
VDWQLVTLAVFYEEEYDTNPGLMIWFFHAAIVLIGV